MAMPGETKSFTFKALKPGLYVYHCATPTVAQHIANGMYGMILIEPEEGLPAVDREFYVMQGELYTVEPIGTQGELTEDYEALIDERPSHYRSEEQKSEHQSLMRISYAVFCLKKKKKNII